MKPVMMHLPDSVVDHVDAIAAARKAARVESMKTRLTPEQIHKAKTILAYEGKENARLYMNSVLKSANASLTITRTGIFTELLEFALMFADGGNAIFPPTSPPHTLPKPKTKSRRAKSQSAA